MLDFAILLSFLTLSHGLVLGGVLFFLASKQKPTKYLGLFLITWGFSFLPNMLSDFGILETNPFLIFLPVRFYFLSFPLLYLYAQEVIGRKEQRILPHLIPGIIEFVVFLGLFLLIPSDVKVEIQESEFYYKIDFPYHLIANVFVLYYLIKTLRLIAENALLVVNYYSSLESKLLKWFKFLCFGFIVITIFNMLILGMYFIATMFDFIISIDTSLILYVSQHITFWILMYWTVFFGYRQFHVQVEKISQVEKGAIHLIEKIEDGLEGSQFVKVFTEEDQLEIDNIFRRLETKIEETKCFIDPELNIADLAKILEIHHRKLSKVINNKANCNFNLFINKYRVEEAKKMMADPDRARFLTLEVVGQEVGFKSRSSIYTAFKRIEGKTPASFLMK